ncbi:phytoene desaturase family protein [Elusimicrobiota bacterium]
MNKANKKYDYDAIIIGAGIGGLVCGCYLAKAGLKTLIIEKNSQAGGYCTSFTRGGFTFDACVHSLGSLEKEGIIGLTLKDLGIENNMVRFNPSDIIITPDYKAIFHADLNKTIDSICSSFPEEKKGVKDFFEFCKNENAISHAHLRNKKLKDLLDLYIKEKKIKAIISLLALGNIGLSPSKLSAFSAAKFYKQFIINGGYYPGKNIQEFPDSLESRFKYYGGEIIKGKLVSEIEIEDGCANSVKTKEGKSISSKHIISDCDARETFLNMIDSSFVKEENKKKLKELVPSPSMFIVYLGIDGHFNGMPDPGVNLWYLEDYDIDNFCDVYKENNPKKIKWFMVRVMPGGRSILAFANAEFMDNDFWQKNKANFRDKFIEKIEKVVPNLSKHIVYKDASTPNTLQKWTLNYKGACYGWAGMPSQLAVPGLSQITFVKNLYLTGHWSTLAQGVPGVVYMGRNTASIIKRKEKIKL